MKLVKLRNISLLLLFFSINFEVWDPLNTGGFFSLSKFLGIIYFATILPHLNKFIVVPKKMRGVLTPLLLFYLLLLLMNIFNLGQYSSDVFSSSILLNIIFFIFIVNHERLVPGIIEKAFIGFLVGALLTVAAFYLGIGVSLEPDGRVSLFGENENIIGIRMVIATFLLTHYLLKYGRTLPKLFVLLLFFAYPPLITLLLNTGSRVSAISLMLGAALFFILYRSKNIAIKAIVISVFLVFSGVAVEYVLNSEVVGHRLINTIEDQDLAGRDYIWLSIRPLIENNILFGVGQTGYIDFTYKVSGKYFSPHNVIIELMSYVGLIGVTLYFLFLYRVFWSSLTYYFKHREVIPLLFAIPIAGLLLSGQILTFKLGWFIFAYAATRRYSTIQNNK